MLIKVCGMRDDDNIRALRNLNPDFIGLIFYSKSSRFVGDKPTAAQKESFGHSLKVGVFVNSETNYIQQKILDFGLDMVQLHGGDGVRQGFAVESLYREIRALRIYEGASDVQRIVIARSILG